MLIKKEVNHEKRLLGICVFNVHLSLDHLDHLLGNLTCSLRRLGLLALDDLAGNNISTIIDISPHVFAIVPIHGEQASLFFAQQRFQ